MTTFKLAAAMSALLVLTGVGTADATQSATIVGLGSDTTETLFDSFAADYHRDPVVTYWATGSPTVTLKAGCAPIARPNGSSPGIRALATRQTAANGSPCIDFARSVAPRSPGAPADSVFYPIANDGLDWAANKVTNAPPTLTLRQVADILECDVTTWDQVGGTSHDTIQPYLPETGPGLANLLHIIAGIDHIGPCVGVSQQDDGTTPQVKDNPNALAFYSIGKYIGQAVYGIADVHGSLRLGNMDGAPPTVFNPGTGRVEVNYGQVPGVQGIPASFRIPEWLVVRKGADGTVPVSLRKFVSWVCGSPFARWDIQNHGFLVSPDCGVAS
ncbi:PstS family phosphate ABC transporter substrate-binding protein [Actinocrispum wychmicini]|uniref:ABC-type phosphate transport system substrate-binding protein n=1 Tax=Actinocrispum wychmicini TaxID=1213861 RepID=A0A4R2K1N3_9PSEU|nr:substrate-binding domain-containing protein [Actinocrispum wychmicini]TCO65602.1 ABC-type phosphate transport system substrate-binding protein [Actinocrispum wychmicini]